MRKLFIVSGVLVVLMVVMITAAVSMTKSWELPDGHVVNVDLTTIEDGIYVGEYVGKPLKAVVRVEVKDHRIVDIVIEQHDNMRGKKGEGIVDRIINQQTLQVDAISGATHSSNAIRKAVGAAFN